MVEGSTRVSDPAFHQPINADLEKDLTLATTLGVLARAVTRGRAERQLDTSPVPRNRLR